LKKAVKQSRTPNLVYTELVDRVRVALAGTTEVSERRMFGGICFLKAGNMCCGVTGDGRLMVRVGPDAYEAVLGEGRARPMDFTGVPLRGFVCVATEALSSYHELKSWVGRGLSFASGLPPR